MSDTRRIDHAHEDSRPKRQFAHKLIVAGADAWLGEVYLSRAGNLRFPFRSFDEFLSILPVITGWETEHIASTAPLACARTMTGPAGSVAHSSLSKFIIALEAPWTGLAYRTRGNSRGKLPFESFGTLISRAVDISGWDLHARTVMNSPVSMAAQTVALGRLRAAM